jgi:hypothetical protein
MRKDAFWNKKKVIAAIKSLDTAGISLGSASVAKNKSSRVTSLLQKKIGSPRTGSALHFAARAHFGSWNAAIIKSGIVFNPIRHNRAFWSRPIIESSIQRLFTSGTRINSWQIERDFTSRTSSLLLSATGRQTTGCALHWAGKKRFKTWNNALRSAGIDPLSLPKDQYYWNKANFRTAISALQSANRPLQMSRISRDTTEVTRAVLKKATGRNLSGRSLYYTARHHLKSWDRGLELAGIDACEIKRRARKIGDSARRKSKLLVVPHQVETIIGDDGKSRRVTLLGTPTKMPDDAVADSQLPRRLESAVRHLTIEDQKIAVCLFDAILNQEESFCRDSVLDSAMSRLGKAVSKEKILLVFSSLASNKELMNALKS